MFKLARRFAEEMIDHARAEIPNECCGLLAGKDGTILQLYRCDSAEKSPFRYYVDPKDQIRIMRELDQKEWDLIGIYHSHTHTEAYPSKTDLELAFYPEALYFIVSLQKADAPVIRAFRIVDGEIGEEEVVVA
ncbi:MAG: M67 family metallopeptidase [candidate division NC10 bacterium]|nr:M67 family metallopeptidase [candidate division NC10 bacterium]